MLSADVWEVINADGDPGQVTSNRHDFPRQNSEHDGISLGRNPLLVRSCLCPL